ncbi:hypothetical protein [Glaciibacter sp. 2TAF33]|uniref:hypothetical protein n=1 Tax=Glaciibacter sp. 2TAF33 TaxID=3233015 RepID=UPI003F910002
MNDNATYRAVLFGPGTIGSGHEMELPYVDGAYQKVVVIDAVENGETISRTYRLGHVTDEPISYRFVEEDDTGGEADVPN